MIKKNNRKALKKFNDSCNLFKKEIKQIFLLVLNLELIDDSDILNQ